MKTKNTILLFGVVILLSACGTTATESPTIDVNQIRTAAAETVVAELTQTAAASSPTPKASPTPTEDLATATIVPTSADLTETPSAAPTVIIEATPTAQLCDDAIFVEDVSVQDGTEMTPGQQFEKVWRIQNTGTCTWGQDYRPAYGYGADLDGQPRALPEIVSPNATVEITVVFTAPLETGEYQSYWRMANAKGVYFGKFFSVKIVVR